MRKRNTFARRYRLRSKARFLGCVAVAAIVLAAAALAAVHVAQARPGLADRPAAAASPAPRPTIYKTAAAAFANLASSGGQHAATDGTATSDWRLMLVNKDNPLPEGYRAELRELPNGLLIDARAYDDLMAMLKEGKSQGLAFVICSAYRSVEKQRALFDGQVAVEQAAGLGYDEAVEVTATKVAPPGTSEHNLGLAVDIVALDYQMLDEGYTDTSECQWLRDNAHRFGFIVRYPEGKSAVTGIIFEPWHYRYVGREAAAAIHENGLCLEEYIGEPAH